MKRYYILNPAVIAMFSLARQNDIERMFAYSSTEHMGLSSFAFGMGGLRGKTNDKGITTRVVTSASGAPA